MNAGGMMRLQVSRGQSTCEQLSAEIRGLLFDMDRILTCGGFAIIALRR